MPLPAAEVHQALGLRCCSAHDFGLWYAAYLRERRTAGLAMEATPLATLATFCSDCVLVAREYMATEGRCVREDMRQQRSRSHVNRGWRGRWSNRWACCQSCGGTDTRHAAHGLCQRCYDAARRPRRQQPAA